MIITKASLNDLTAIMLIIQDAKSFLKENGSLQWNTPDGYPNAITFNKDILNNNCYIIKDKDVTCGVYTLIKEIDHNYDIIYHGSWQNVNSNYYSIHRIAVKKEYYHTDAAKMLIEHAINEAKLCNKESVKVDTHELNKAMQGLLIKCGFVYQGIIYLANQQIDNKRLAFELNLITKAYIHH